VAYETQLALFFRDTINIARIFDSFYDIRMQPRIRLKDILISVFLMPYWGLKALLQLDFLLRTPQILKLFRCPKNKKVVVSDTTIARVLNWLDPDDSRKSLLAPLQTLNKEGLLHRRLTPKGHTRRLGVIDGSQMGDHYLVAALLCGQLNYPVLAELCKGRGYEQTTTQKFLPIIHQMLGSAAPQLWLFDALYFNHTIFRIVGEQNAHLLIKYSPHENDEEESKLFRDVLEDAKRLFAANTPAIDPVEQSHGFDSNRWCSWSMKKTSAEFAAVPVNISLLVEDYPKRRKTPTRKPGSSPLTSASSSKKLEKRLICAGKSKTMNSNVYHILPEPRHIISKIHVPFSRCCACFAWRWPSLMPSSLFYIVTRLPPRP
jgi:hypothetical protein